MAVTKALADPSRVRILLALRQGELCVCQITELFAFAPATISKHLSILQQAGLICSRKSARWVYYRLPDKSAAVAVREALDWVHKSLARTDEAATDPRNTLVARRSAKGMYAQARIVSQRRQSRTTRRVTRLLQRIFDEGVMRLFALGNAEFFLCNGFPAERREQGAEFAQLAGIV